MSQRKTSENSSEQISRGTGIGAPPPPPPPPPSSSLRGISTPKFQPSSVQATQPDSTIRSNSSTGASDMRRCQLDPETLKNGRISLRSTADYQPIRQYPPGVSDGGMGGPSVTSLKWHGSDRPQFRTMVCSPTGEKVSPSAPGANYNLPVGYETRTSYPLSPSAMDPLSESHLLSLVGDEVRPQVSPNYASYKQQHSPNSYQSNSPSPGGQPLLHQAISRKEQQMNDRNANPLFTPERTSSLNQPLLYQAISNRENTQGQPSPLKSPGSLDFKPLLQQAIDNRDNVTPKRSPGVLNSDYNYNQPPLLQAAIAHRETHVSHKRSPGVLSSDYNPNQTPLLQNAIANRENHISPKHRMDVNANPTNEVPLLQSAIAHRENMPQVESKPRVRERSSSPFLRPLRCVTPDEFSPGEFCRELRDTQLSSKSPNQYQKPLASYSPRTLRAFQRTPVPISFGPPTGDDVDSLTDRMMYNMETGSGAAGDYNCAKCGEGISAEAPGCTALNETYHLDCFVCTTCGNRLAGGSFYAVDGKPYCEKDYIDTLEKCTVCNKPIMDRILRASGQAFHPGCFVCTACSKCLDGVPFTIDSNNQVHCVQCFHDKYAPRCAMCSKPIVPEEGKEDSLRVVAMDKSFHVDCYKCEDCGLKLSSKIEGHGCYPLDGHLLCKSCNAERVAKLTADA